MTYQVETGNSIAYELLLSLLLYKRRANLKYLDKGIGWITDVQERLTAEFEKELAQFEDLALGNVACLLIEKCPQNQQIELFLSWLKGLTAAEMYELLAPHIREVDLQILLDLEKQRNQLVYFLSKWNEQYFQFEKMEDKLEKAVHVFNKQKEQMSSVQLVEHFATGLQIEIKDIKHVIMIPSIHFSPLHTFSILREKIFVWFPLKTEPSNIDELIRIGKSLSDRKRLDILQFLSVEKHTFTDVLKYIGGAKGNIHHHIMTLRAAGLVRVHLTGESQFYLSTRKEFASELREKLNSVTYPI
ncbi:DNA-binding transcriptional regulator, ArsR family [Thermoactinomyces sp. DSM 45891]|uniref:winged helix-turn-helix domain-containing protein n=1 Tax=Thermoactinomyces sp. DSM 45891 TaxID=1761907 RepID=UPI000915AE2D|nr:winged helix-turn-helix domain-containing protein [Thermoactinomyces sp. DSM 45891]SFX33130.1 DNA-binding transcriptional regulator, ArsR family [Thermoactinomyces sp. DSM 45891]